MRYNMIMSSNKEDTGLKWLDWNSCSLPLTKYSNTEGITAVELAKLVNLPVDEVKRNFKF